MHCLQSFAQRQTCFAPAGDAAGKHVDLGEAAGAQLCRSGTSGRPGIADQNHRALFLQFAEPVLQHLVRTAARDLLYYDRLLVMGLTIDSRLVAVFYGFVDNQTVYYYAGGFDPEFASCSPGTLLIARAIELAGRRGMTQFDFMRGEEPYKHLWGARSVPTFERSIHHA